MLNRVGRRRWGSPHKGLQIGRAAEVEFKGYKRLLILGVLFFSFIINLLIDYAIHVAMAPQDPDIDRHTVPPSRSSKSGSTGDGSGSFSGREDGLREKGEGSVDDAAGESVRSKEQRQPRKSRHTKKTEPLENEEPLVPEIKEEPQNDGQDDAPEAKSPLVTFKIRVVARKVACAVLRVLKSVWLACAFCLAINIGLFIVESIMSQQVGTIVAVPLISAIFTIIVVVMEVLRRQRKFQNLVSKKGIYLQLWSAFKYGMVIVYLGLSIGYIVTLITGTTKNPLILDNDTLSELNLLFSNRVTIIILSIVAMLANILVLVHVWEVSKKGKVQILIVIACLVNFIISVAEIKISSNANNDMIWDHEDDKYTLPMIYIYTESFSLCGSLIGLSVGAIVNERNRLSDTVGQFLFLHDGFMIVLAVLSLVSAIDSIVRQHVNGYLVPTSLNVFYFYTFVLCLLLISCSRYLRSRRPPSFDVEELDLSRLTEAQKSAFAKLITYNKTANPGVSGESVIAMMEAYSKSPLENMHCTVLRVYKSERIKQEERDQAQAGLADLDTWDVIDREGTIFDEEATLHEEPIVKAPQPMSKNKRKKLAKKAAAGGADYPLECPTDQDIKEQVKFHSDLMATEALVLFTTIEAYDLTAPLTGKFGRFLQRNFGKESKSQLLCFRIGLLGFHWPFVRSTFYCQNSDKPVARSAAVMHALGKWNKKMASSQRCSVMIDPTITNTPAEQAIRLGGWYNINLPASHIINMKPHKGKSLTDYFKAVKYRSQEAEFKRSHGEVIEIKEPTDEHCQTIVDLWEKIAEGRSEGGYTATLAAPNKDFIKLMTANSNNKCDRTLLFLKVDGKVIASCVLFRIGDTITSDIQGLDHELARPMKGYFVMMQETIAIALKEGKDFVDFGPTTEKAKLSIGCKSVPLTGALFTNFPLLSFVVSIAAAHVKV